MAIRLHQGGLIEPSFDIRGVVQVDGRDIVVLEARRADDEMPAVIPDDVVDYLFVVRIVIVADINKCHNTGGNGIYGEKRSAPISPDVFPTELQGIGSHLRECIE